MGPDLYDTPDEHLVQDDLFSGARWIVRTTTSGTVVRLRVVPAGRGQVTIERFERRRPGERAFRRKSDEEGRTVALGTLSPDLDYETLFGTERVT